MTQSDLTESVRAEIARDLKIGRINEEIRRAQEELAAAPKTFTGTERMLAARNLHLWMAKKLAFERGLAL